MMHMAARSARGAATAGSSSTGGKGGEEGAERVCGHDVERHERGEEMQAQTRIPPETGIEVGAESLDEVVDDEQADRRCGLVGGGVVVVEMLIAMLGLLGGMLADSCWIGVGLKAEEADEGGDEGDLVGLFGDHDSESRRVMGSRPS
ncbi:hypothetical protein L1887_51415 [Cichorium endivia]|nr:hypothetical protein L1887_51415 [Cichorium endivia]